MKTSKFILFPLFVLLLTSGTTFAQAKFGLKGGLNHANIKQSGKSIIDTSQIRLTPIAYWHAGMIVNIPIAEKISIQTELLFTLQGAQSSFYADLNNNYSVKYKYAYISLPILFEYKIGKFSAEAGPGFSYLVGSDHWTDNPLINFEHTSRKENFEVSASIGFKYTMNRLFTQLRWEGNLTPLWKWPFTDVNGEPAGSSTSHMTSFQLSLGYYL